MRNQMTEPATLSSPTSPDPGFPQRPDAQDLFGVEDLPTLGKLVRLLVHHLPEFSRVIPILPRMGSDPAALTGPKVRPALAVDLDPQDPSVTVAGERFRVSAAGAAFVAALLEANGCWISSADLALRPEMEGVRLDRVRKRLPLALRKLVESKRGTGYRLKPRELA